MQRPIVVCIISLSGDQIMGGDHATVRLKQVRKD